MALEFEGEGSTLLIVNAGINGHVFLSAANFNWSAKPDQKYDINYELSQVSYSGGKSAGLRSNGRSGFVTTFPTEFLDEFAVASYLHIKAADGKVIDKLSLDGSAAGIAQLRRCVAHVKAQVMATAREKARFQHIPKDPFATMAGEPTNPATSATPPRTVEPARARANLASYFSADDYPAAAILAEEQGTTRFRLGVGPDGRVTDCQVTGSSGSSSLDSTTCRILRARARFSPATDSNGSPIADTVSGAYRWVRPAQ